VQSTLFCKTLQVAAKLIPDTNAFLMTNKHAVVLFFRGTEPAKLLEWWSDADVSDSGLHTHHSLYYQSRRICHALIILRHSSITVHTCT